MVFDPSKSDVERMYDKVEKEFPDAWIEIYNKFGQDMLKVEPPSGDKSRENAEKIESFLSDKGLDTSLNALSDEGDLYEVTATAGAWKKE